MLSIGTKLLARVVATRMATWAEGFVHESQCGFRRGRGVDDVAILSRKMAEEMQRIKVDDWLVMSFFDIEKAYPRVCKDALWELLARRGRDGRMVKICKALHEHTQYRVRIHAGLSEPWVPDRGLREGCPSSPPLFNIYHDAVMEDFRARRAEQAEEEGQIPGVSWSYKVDGKLKHKANLRRQGETHGFAKEVWQTVIGDFGFADDTGIVGWEEEMATA